MTAADALMLRQEDQSRGLAAERARCAETQAAGDGVSRDALVARTITVGRKQFDLKIGHRLLLAGLLVVVNGCGGKTRTVIQMVPVTTSCLPDVEVVPARPAIVHGCPKVHPDLQSALEATEHGQALLRSITALELCFDTAEAVKLASYRDRLERLLRTWRHTYCPRKEPK